MERTIQLENAAKKLKKAVSTRQLNCKNINLDNHSLSKGIPEVRSDSKMTECRRYPENVQNDRKK